MNKKQEVITFKVDKDLLEMIKKIPNRSEFIRTAILSAMGTVCPLCSGNGILTPNQKRHWDDLSVHHSMKNCSECHERVLFCSNA
jgi:hypothetical protein